MAQKSTVDDILGLFGNSAPASSPAPPPAAPAQPPPTAAFTLPQTQSPPPQPVAPKLTAYMAYDKNELRISLTPQTSPQRPGVVNILARFQVTGSTPVTGLTFQAAVPKVKVTFSYACSSALTWSLQKSQQLQMLPMSNSDIHPGATETQQMRVIAPAGVRLSALSFSFAVTDSWTPGKRTATAANSIHRRR